MGIQTNISKVVATLFRELGVPLVQRNIWVGVLPLLMVVLVVVKKDTRCETALESKKEGKRSIKLP